MIKKKFMFCEQKTSYKNYDQNSDSNEFHFIKKSID